MPMYFAYIATDSNRIAARWAYPAIYVDLNIYLAGFIAANLSKLHTSKLSQFYKCHIHKNLQECTDSLYICKHLCFKMIKTLAY